jgi:bifunctional non-homologous end joining protein LigD
MIARATPAGFVPPCIPILMHKPPSGDNWLHEVKQDGFRIIARRAGPDLNLWSRNAIDYADRMTRITGALKRLRVKSCTLDGEAVLLRADGRSNFYGMKGSIGLSHAVLVAFDLLELNGVDWRRKPIEERRARLAKLLAAPPDGILLSQVFAEDGPIVFAHACALGVEGIISKLRGSTYHSGRNTAWRKTICPTYRRQRV